MSCGSTSTREEYLDSSSDRKNVIVTSVRNEASLILEWIAYHKAIGFHEIVVFYNDCSDGTKDILTELDRLSVVRAFENKVDRSSDAQVTAFTRARALPSVRSAAWAIILDCDEFINVKIGDGSIRNITEFCEDNNVDAIAMQMRHFGSSNNIFLENKLTIEQFCLSSKLDDPDNLIVKSLHRYGEAFSAIAMHTPFFKPKTAYVPRIINGSGKLIDPSCYENNRFTRIPKEFSGHDMVQINHYAVRSLDQYLMKIKRGVGSGPLGRYNASYWNGRDKNEEKDTSILRWSDRTKSLMSQWLSDKNLARAVKSASNLSDLERLQSMRDAPEFVLNIAKRLTVERMKHIHAEGSSTD